jgi:DNA helicase-2/ATP-dependent DNA helicase PcrA
LLNANQQAAVDEDRNTVVVAGPGSGKTRVIIAKILKIQSADPKNRVCAVTFTRDAANELTLRVERELVEAFGARRGKELLGQCRIGTFHSLTIQQLREIGQLGKLATPKEQSGFIALAARSAATPEGTMSYEDAVMAIENAKCSMLRDATLMRAPVVETYQRVLQRNRMGDLYDVIRDAVLGMRDGRVKPMQSGGLPCTHLLVDEFQDSDEVQYAWIMEHVTRGIQTMVVGDDDQTIFEWRRALGYKGVQQFKEDAGACEIVLGENYRCREEILSYADNLIRYNRGSRIEKRLVAAKGRGGSVETLAAETQLEQAELLIEQIEPFCVPSETDRFTFTVEQGAWSIIARNHLCLNTIEAQLICKGIQYQRAGGGLWKLTYLAVFLALLKSLQQGTSSGIEIAFHHMGVESKSLDELHRVANGKFSRYLDGEILHFESIGSKDAAFLTNFALKASGWRDSLKIGAYNHVITGVAALVQEELLHRQNDAPKVKLLGVAADIVMGMGKYTIRTAGGGTRSPSLSERVNKLEEPRPKGGAGVALHTMHSCKGLEFDNVGIFEVSTGIIPDAERIDDINDRRLLYVAMTRARERLFMSYKSAARSRFFDEIGLLPS